MIWKLNETDIKFELLRVRNFFGKKWEIIIMSVRWVVKLNPLCDGVYYRLIAINKNCKIRNAKSNVIRPKFPKYS